MMCAKIGLVWMWEEQWLPISLTPLAAVESRDAGYWSHLHERRVREVGALWQFVNEEPVLGLGHVDCGPSEVQFVRRKPPPRFLDSLPNGYLPSGFGV